MTRAIAAAVLLILCVTSPQCDAQNLAPVIQLTPAETAKAKQLSQELRHAMERDSRAKAAWQSLHQIYQASHPELPGIRFTADFRMAFAVKRSESFYTQEMATIELSPDERKKIEGLYREMRAADESFTKARNGWQDFQYELISNHVPSTGSDSNAVLSDGRTLKIPTPWAGGIVFTSDFRIIVPRVF